MILRHFHIEIRTGVSNVLGSEDGAFLADQQGRTERIAANIVRANGQVAYFEALDTVDVQALVYHSVLDDGIAFARSHAACSQAVPGCFDMALHPFLNFRDIFFAILNRLVSPLLVGVEYVGR